MEQTKFDPREEGQRCGTCDFGDGIFCYNPASEYYGCFRNDWKYCEKWEPEKDEEETL